MTASHRRSASYSSPLQSITPVPRPHRMRFDPAGFWEQRGYHVTGDVWREERYAHQE